MIRNIYFVAIISKICCFKNRKYIDIIFRGYSVYNFEIIKKATSVDKLSYELIINYYSSKLNNLKYNKNKIQENLQAVIWNVEQLEEK